MSLKRLLFKKGEGKKRSKPSEPAEGDYRIMIYRTNSDKFHWSLDRFVPALSGVWVPVFVDKFFYDTYDEAFFKACVEYDSIIQTKTKSSSEILVKDLLKLEKARKKSS